MSKAVNQVAQEHAQAVLAVLQGTGQPLTALDAYQVAKRTGLSAMECGRALSRLEEQGAVVSADEAGTANDLARRFSVKTKQNAPAATV